VIDSHDELPPINGFDIDYATMMSRLQQAGGGSGHEVPPTHPGKHVEITDNEMERHMSERFGGKGLFQTGQTFKSKYGHYDVSDEAQREELENMINNCLQKKWLLAREEWQHLPDGRTIVTVKCLEPDPLPLKKTEDEA